MSKGFFFFHSIKLDIVQEDYFKSLLEEIVLSNIYQALKSGIVDDLRIFSNYFIICLIADLFLKPFDDPSSDLFNKQWSEYGFLLGDSLNVLVDEIYEQLSVTLESIIVDVESLLNYLRLREVIQELHCAQHNVKIFALLYETWDQSFIGCLVKLELFLTHRDRGKDKLVDWLFTEGYLS